MKHLLKKIFTIAALLSMVAAEANNVTPTLVYRSQGFHGDRQRDVGMVGHINLFDMESWHGTMDIAVGKTLVMEHNGTGVTPLNLSVTINYHANTDGGYLS